LFVIDEEARLHWLPLAVSYFFDIFSWLYFRFFSRQIDTGLSRPCRFFSHFLPSIGIELYFHFH